MDPKSFASHLQHQNMYGNDNQRLNLPDGPSLANHFVFRSLFEGGGDKLMQHFQQQQHQYRNDGMSHDLGHEEPQNLHKSNDPLPLPHHQEESTYTCPEQDCGKIFTNKRSFTMHFNMHRKQNRSGTTQRNPSPSPPTHQCPECDKRYRSQGGLYWHEQTVHKKRVFNCTLCSKIFKSYCGYYLHRKGHEGQTFECKHCFKTYSQKGTLKAHLKTHLGEESMGGGN